MSFREFVLADQRLLILRSLREMTGCSANESILDSCLDAYGHSVSRDAVRTQMRWLEEQGLLTVEKVGETLVAKLTGRGDDVATGQAVVDGVKKPRPV
ncbi:repressor of nif and glnA expression [Aeromonas caviae]|uniref:VpaChn25_0724 family phage protein n=1 Tax=Aeromonas TaxID=642 RepID=UPI00209EE63D|nr:MULTISPECIES: ArsR family transcriptional regulator [Aeromonas]MCP1601442.1 repressor of nif and glnA expression [Aeromonas caviae]